jgi:hypothetical protein
MTDREMLLLAYGAIKALSTEVGKLREVVTIIEEHLWPPVVVNGEASDEQPG